MTEHVERTMQTTQPHTPPITQHGRIKLIMGPMFASKSTELIAEIRRNVIAKKKCAIIKFDADTRYSTDAVIISHDGSKLETPTAFSVTKLEECNEAILANNIQVVGIDEGQFFTDVAEYADAWAMAGIKVVISALDGDYNREMFPAMLRLISRCEDIVKLHAICANCYSEDGAFTYRTTVCKSVIDIGGSDKYVPLCRKCYNEAQHSAKKII